MREPSGSSLRSATEEDLVALLDLERAATLAGLAHVYPPQRHPFPDHAVLARWALVLAEPGTDVLVLDRGDGPGLDLLVAHDDHSLRHLAVRPERWGRGLATAAISSVLAAIAGRGGSTAELWCLADNRRARELYERLGWRETVPGPDHPGPTRREAPWPPYPTEVRYSCPTT